MLSPTSRRGGPQRLAHLDQPRDDDDSSLVAMPLSDHGDSCSSSSDDDDAGYNEYDYEYHTPTTAAAMIRKRHPTDIDDEWNDNPLYGHPSPSKYVSKHNTKRRHPSGSPSLLERMQLRIVGRWRRAKFGGVAVACIACYLGISLLMLLWMMIGTSNIAVLQQVQVPVPMFSPQNNQHSKTKPIMIGFFFRGVESSTFTGKIQSIDPPTSHEAYMAMLQPQQQHSHHHHHPTRSVEPMSDPETFQEIREDSESYDRAKPKAPQQDPCSPQYDWQSQSFPNCNVVHEAASIDRMFLPIEGAEATHKSNKLRRRLVSKVQQQQQPASSSSTSEPHSQFRMLAHGYWRDTWRMNHPVAPATSSSSSLDHHNHGETIALKTKRYHHDFSEYIYDKQRRDAVTSDRIQFSSQAIHMYGACGTSGLYEYAPGGDLYQLLDKFETAQDWMEYYSSGERYILAYNVTSALKDLHTTEQHNTQHPHGQQHSNDSCIHNHNKYSNTAAIVHGDFNANQFVAMSSASRLSWKDLYDDQNQLRTSSDAHHHALPQFKLGDFNLAQFVYWNKEDHHPCVVQPDGAGGQFRAPEEYAHQHGRTEKVDIYSLGNLVYSIVTGHWPFDDLDHAHGVREIKELVQQGRRPHINIDSDVVHSTDPYVQAMLQAVQMCWKQDPHERASAQEVEAYLGKLLPRAKQETEAAAAAAMAEMATTRTSKNATSKLL